MYQNHVRVKPTPVAYHRLTPENIAMLEQERLVCISTVVFVFC